MKDAIAKTLAELVAFLARHEIRFAVIGGIAVMVRGEPRFTADIALIAILAADEAIALLDSLRDGGFRPLFPDVESVVRSAYLLPLRHERTGIGVDVALGLTGFEQQVVERAGETVVGPRTLPIATAEDLILLKLIAGRPRDTDDAYRIMLRQSDTLDWEYLAHTGRELQESLAQDLVPQIMRWRREIAGGDP